MARSEVRSALRAGVALLVLGLGCGSSSPPPPISDPGGSFHTNVSPTKTLGALSDADVAELCSEFATADQSYLHDAVTREVTCRESALEAAHWGNSLPLDGGTFLSVCQAAYDQCQQEVSMVTSTPCIVPAPGCTATVELLSACLNEIANTNPIAMCANLPTCATASLGGPDGGKFPTLTGPCWATASVPTPSLPACDRLQQQCLGVDTRFNPYF
jgi:hypothetical protein